MKPFFLLLFCFFFAYQTEAQNTAWFYGTWKGETYFPNGPITRHIIIRLNVTQVSGTYFTATLSNLFPSDTIVRMERAITGDIANKQLLIKSNEETYIRDPRTQNFWYDCTSCPTTCDFSINKDKVVIKITTLKCGDVCNGETVFTRDTTDFNSAQKIQLAKWLGLVSNDSVETNKKRRDTIIVAKAKLPVVLPQKDTVAIPSSVARKEVIKPAGKPVAKDTTAMAAVHKKELRKDTLLQSTVPKHDSVISPLTSRVTNLLTTYHVMSPHITIQLYDNAEIDGDVVSVYHNGKLIADHQSLTHKAIAFTIEASKEDSHHEFVMVAENLGLIPPNTALMRITAGNQKFELEISSDFDNNTKIAIDYTGE